MDDLLTEFLTETAEGLADLDNALLHLERTPDDAATVSRIFRLMHTIKGTCGFLGLPRLERVAHAAEDLLGRVRDGVEPVTETTINRVLATVDRVKLILAALAESGAEPAGDDAALIASMAEPAPAPSAPAIIVPDSPVPASQPPASLTAAAAPAGESAIGGQSIRVAVPVLDNLMTLVSELVLTRNQLLQLARAAGESAFSAPLQRLSHITSELQEGVMKTRMQPIANAWAKLPRLVRDLARDLGKRIELVTEGAETELDRQILEMIRDPLTHMVRNSADHGIETPAERQAAGKPAQGRITLSAVHQGGHIVITIADDGRGLDGARIRAKALAQGLVSEADLATMPEAQILRFIFRPGFSTAAAVTAVSGRGVGMDVVKTNIERIGGTIDLFSTLGQGSGFIIKIPLTLAIAPALIVAAGAERFALPQIGVLELVRVGAGSAHRIEHVSGTKVLRLREQLLPLVDLAALLELPATAARDDAHVVVVQVGAALFGILVDLVFDTEEIVVKPTAPVLRHLTIFGGTTILGDGSVIMILDPHGIARHVGIAASGTEQKTIARTDDGREPLLLVRAGGRTPVAVPLGLVARLERIRRDLIEPAANSIVTQYRGRLMPLLAVAPRPADPAEWPEESPVLVVANGPRMVGLVVDEILDVSDEHLRIELASPRPGILGSAVVAGRATDLLDTDFWLAQAWPDWSGQAPGGAAAGHGEILSGGDDADRSVAAGIEA